MIGRRQQLREAWVEHQRGQATSRPVVVALGHLHYDELKAEVEASVAETVPGYAPHSDTLDALNPIGLIHALNCAGVECFYWSGMIVLRIRSTALTSILFL